MNLYAIIKRPIWWSIFICICQKRFWRLDKALDYLGRRLNRREYQLQLRGWELDKKLKEINARIAKCQGKGTRKGEAS